MKKPKAPSVEELNSSADRGEVEAQAQEALASIANQTALVKQSDLPKLETVKNVNAGKEMTVARFNGKFVRKATVLAAETAKRITKVAYTPDASGQTQVEQVIAEQLHIAKGNTEPKNLGQVASFLEHLDEASGQKLIRSKMAKEPEQQHQVRVVLIVSPPGVLPMEKHVEVVKPSWVRDAKVISQDGPSGMLEDKP